MARTNKQRLFLVLIVLAVVLLALGGWAVQRSGSRGDGVAPLTAHNDSDPTHPIPSQGD